MVIEKQQEVHEGSGKGETPMYFLNICSGGPVGNGERAGKTVQEAIRRLL